MEILKMETCVTSKGQIVIPVQLRKEYGIKPGTRVVVLDNGDSIILKPMTEEYLKKLQGLLKGKGGLKTLLDYRHNEAR